MASHNPEDETSNESTTMDMEFIGSRDEGADARTVESRRRLRDSLQSDVEAFLAGGGKIQQIEPNVQADPPTKPNSSYGSRPI